jgi:hypothetical protein
LGPPHCSGENGKCGIHPLLIKSKNDVEVDSSPSCSDSSGSPINITIDRIALGSEHLTRKELFGKLQTLVSSNSIVLLTSPLVSGKSSLCMLYKAATPNVQVFGIPFDDRTPFEHLCDEGIDLKKRAIAEK